MPEEPVVLDNTPLVALWTIGRLDLLRDLFEEVLIPVAVREEFLAIEEAVRREALVGAGWISSVSLEHPGRALGFPGLDQGEAEVLALAEERHARLVVIDERKARRYAARLGLRVTGTLGLLILAKERGLIPSVAEAIDRLQRAGLYLSHQVVQRTLQLAGEATA